MTGETISVRELARKALSLQGDQAAELKATMLPIEKALGSDSAALRGVLEKAASAPNDEAALDVFWDALGAELQGPAPPATYADGPMVRENERVLVACALQDAATARDLVADVHPAMFGDYRLARTWSALKRVLDAQPSRDVPMVDAVATELGGEGGEALSRIKLHELSLEVPSAANAAYYKRQVVAAFVRREAVGMIGEVEAERTRDMTTSNLLLGVEARARRLRELSADRTAPDKPVDVTAFADEPQPEPIIWRADPGQPDDTNIDAVLSAGEVTVLASAGGLGKSTLTLDMAGAAVMAAEFDKNSGASCGLRIAAGPVMIVSYEDSPSRIWQRVTWTLGRNVPKGLLLWPRPMPLWISSDRGASFGPGAEWERLWHAVRANGVRLVIIDPASVAAPDVPATSTGPTRAFMDAMIAEIAPRRADGWKGAGALVVSHDTKGARNAVARGEAPGAGVVAGSAAWWDGARGVLSLMRDPAGRTDRLLECVKSNYGRERWGARLVERIGERGAFHGLELGASLSREGMEAAKLAEPRKRRNTDDDLKPIP